MLIIIHSLLSIVFTYIAGFGIVTFFGIRLSNNRNELSLKYIIPIVGYSFSQIIFWCSYALIGYAQPAFIFSLIIILLINLIFVLISIKTSFNSEKKVLSYLPTKDDIPLFIILIIIFLIGNWQYIAIGEGHYLHSGNEDFFDNINGGTAYLNYSFHNISYDYISNFRLSYSSQAFWRMLLHVGGVDGFLIQSILNITLTSLGVYWLIIAIFKGSRKIGLLASFWSVAANFYLTTFLNGHIGSMMYASVAPVLIGIIILWGRKELNSYWLILALVIFIFTHFAYPGPVYFLLIPAVLLIIHEKVYIQYGIDSKLKKYLIKKNSKTDDKLAEKFNWYNAGKIAIIFFVAAFLFTLWVYNYFEPRRIHALLRTNVSWKISLFKEMFMVFWGVYPSGSTGTLSALPIFISNDTINTISLIFALILTIVVIFAGIKCRFNKNRHYLFIYTIMFLPFFVMMRYFWGSPYYFYKFLYVNYFIVVIILFLWIGDFLKSNKHILAKKLLLPFLIFVGILNITWDISIGVDYYNRPYNNKDKVEDFLSHTTKTELSKAYLEIPNFLYNMVFSYIFKENGYSLQESKQNAKYLIQLHNFGEVYHNSISHTKGIYDNGLLKLVEHSSQNSITTTTLYEPEHAGNTNINWVGNDLSVTRGVLKTAMAELIGFLKKNNHSKYTFVDIANNNIYLLLDNAFNSNNLKLQKYAFNAHWLLQEKGGRSIFADLSNAKKIWNNEFFQIISLPQDKQRKIKELPEKPDLSGLVSGVKKNGNAIYLDIPKSEQLYLYLAQYLREKGIEIVKNPAKTDLFCQYIIYPPYSNFNYKTIKDSSRKVLWQSTSFNIIKRYWDIQLVKIPYYGREIVNDSLLSHVPVRMLNYLSKGDFRIKISNLTKEAKYIRTILSPGPSIDYSNFLLDIANKNDEYMKEYAIVSPKVLIDIPLSNYTLTNDSTLDLYFEGKNIIGHSLLPLDDRYLNYQIQALELTDRIDVYSDYMLKALNNRIPSRLDRFLSFFIQKNKLKEIINKTDSTLLFLGTGWYPFESLGDESFRWIGEKPAEIIINNNDLSNKVLNIKLEPGPGCAGKPLKLNVFFNNKLVSKENFEGRDTLKIDLSNIFQTEFKNQNIVKLVPLTENAKISGDKRILNFRVFNISLNTVKKSANNDIIKGLNSKLLRLGTGWYLFETFNNESFRWVGKKPAEIIINSNDLSNKVLNIKLEPGPGCAGKPLKLNVFFNGKLVSKEKFDGKNNVIIDFSKNPKLKLRNENILKLVPITKHARIANDIRILNFRVFNIKISNKN